MSRCFHDSLLLLFYNCLSSTRISFNFITNYNHPLRSVLRVSIIKFVPNILFIVSAFRAEKRPEESNVSRELGVDNIKIRHSRILLHWNLSYKKWQCRTITLYPRHLKFDRFLNLIYLGLLEYYLHSRDFDHESKRQKKTIGSQLKFCR